MTALTPLRKNGKVVPNAFEDDGKSERGFHRCQWEGEIVYAHESGYGFLHECDVQIKEAT